MGYKPLNHVHIFMSQLKIRLNLFQSHRYRTDNIKNINFDLSPIIMSFNPLELSLCIFNSPGRF